MKRDPQIIASEIMNLVSELAALAGVPASSNPTQLKSAIRSVSKDKSGATGGLRQLVEDGKFDSPKQMSEIKEMLKQEGRHYPKSTTAMGLVYLVRERVLTRFKDGGGKGWKYAVRR